MSSTKPPPTIAYAFCFLMGLGLGFGGTFVVFTGIDGEAEREHLQTLRDMDGESYQLLVQLHTRGYHAGRVIRRKP